MFTIPKGGDPKHLVSTERERGSKYPNQKKIAYVWKWRPCDIETLKQLHRAYRLACKNAENTKLLPHERSLASETAGDLIIRIAAHKKKAAAAATIRRKSADGRRLRHTSSKNINEFGYLVDRTISDIKRIVKRIRSTKRRIPAVEWRRLENAAETLSVEISQAKDDLYDRAGLW